MRLLLDQAVESAGL